MEHIQNLAYELHELLTSSKEFIYLKECERNMLTDDVANNLIKDYHKAQEQYNFDKSDEVLNMLHNAKLKMDQNELVILYKKAYKEYQILVGNITDIVFKDFKNESLVDKIIRAKWIGSNKVIKGRLLQ